ncbi:MAG: hypothetical protein H7338_13540 [Candidatus Sericytochromatia bacterium]|nr:hypothetical protein [Candidatus Sericytochromatia bacterium]
MKKDDVLQRREKIIRNVNESLARLGRSPLVDDGKLYHAEIDGENRWAQRLSRPEHWPHVPEGGAPLAMPGLRYEIWYFQKRPEAWVALLCNRREPAGALIDALKPLWKDWLTSGKYAKRYLPLNATWQSVYPETDGIWRAVPLDDKLDKGLEQLTRDTLGELEKAVTSVDPAGELARSFQTANQERDLLAELAAKFSKNR